MQGDNENKSSNTIGSTHPACASCKHQRKKCNNDCILAPYFPADKNREFQAVHKVFGVSNVQKLIRNLKGEDQKKAVESLVWEASCRQKDPVQGPYGEYKRVCDELTLYKNQIQMMQLPGQGATMFKLGMPMMGWNGNHGMINNNNNNNMLNFNQENDKLIFDSNTYCYPSTNVERLKNDHVGVDVTLTPQIQQQQQMQYPINQFYLSGQFGPN